MMREIKFYNGESVPLEMHKTRIVQKLNLVSVERRLKAMQEAGFNTFLLKNTDVFLDMLTDSGVNAMSDRQQAAMMVADDSYAGSHTFTKLQQKCEELFGTSYFLPTHQGRAAENVLAQVFVKPGDLVPTNYHFTTTKAHITLNGGEVVEIPIDEALVTTSQHPFKGNLDLEKLGNLIKKEGAERISSVRMEAGANLIGGQPFSLENLEAVRQLCDGHDILLILDASLLSDNLYFMKKRDPICANLSIKEITARVGKAAHIIYFSGRKLGCARGGGICTNDETLYNQMRELIPLYEGFLTYGGMSVREMEALVIGLDETMDEDVISQGPKFIAYMVDELKRKGIPVVTPAGGLGCHVNAREFVGHIPATQYPAASLASAFYIASGIRGMERGTLSEQRDEDGLEQTADLELLRLALPRRVFTLSQIKYCIDRLSWLYEHRHLIQGLQFVEEPKNLRFFFGRLAPTSDWPTVLANNFEQSLGKW